ncbi:MAG TPA: rod shape-determining protein MreC [Candidatus Paceibacterota bacterium]|nr:rod shape-determining protein MreC [Candidatus Paceibacterota bacterium]
MKSYLSKTRESSLRRSDAGGLRRLVAWIVVAFLVLLLARGPLGALGSMVTSPAFSFRHWLETSSATIPVFVRSRLELESEINDLRSKLAAEEGRNAAFSFVTDENRELRALFASSSSPRILAGVISRPPLTPYDTLIIDRGAEDGVIEDAPVYFGNDRAVGYVRTVFSGSALVSLFSSPGAESTVYVFGPNIFTTAEGEGGGVIHLSVPQGIEVKAGDVVVLPSLDGGVLGLVDHVTAEPTEPEQDAYVLYDVPLQSVRLVAVGTTPVRPVSWSEATDEVDRARAVFTFDIPSTTPEKIAPSTTTP